MKTASLSLLALGAVVFAAPTELAVLWAAEPVRLTETQMDAVAAGTMAVGTGALAIAGGSDTYTYTSTSTTVISGSTPTNTVDIGLGSGTAVACCGSGTYTTVEAVYYAEGDRVSASSIVTDTQTSQYSFSFGIATVIAVDTPPQ